MANNYLFSGLIKCNRCKGNYRGKKDRNIPVYICSNYNNYIKCERGTIKELALIEFTERYCEDKNLKMEYTNEYMKSIIEEINVGYDTEIEIKYKDGHVQHYKNNNIKF